MKITAPKTSPLLELLALLAPEASKTNLRSWVKEKRIYVNQKNASDPRMIVEEGAVVSLRKKEKRLKFGITILYEDRDLIVINKPEGLLSVATDFQNIETAHNALKRKFYKQKVTPVHRLDQGTSGVMVFAYSERALEGLKEQFRGHLIHREYQAYLEGHLKPNKGTWESYLREDGNYFVHSSKDESQGVRAVTNYAVIKRTPKLTQVRFILETGKKNQIRAQAKEYGHPVVGDKKYGATLNPFSRLALHATRLMFIHPMTKKEMTFETEVPFFYQ